jgi:hypothetical protein
MVVASMNHVLDPYNLCKLLYLLCLTDQVILSYSKATVEAFSEQRDCVNKLRPRFTMPVSTGQNALGKGNTSDPTDDE